MKKYEFVTIENIYAGRKREKFEDHLVYRIYNNKSRTQIGLLSWYKPWKQYVFSSQPEHVFDNFCLRDVIDFIENEIPKEKL